ncbi:MAG TPA: aminodeoxychorismate synthase component I [Solirubrobacterales bacterium]|nr:aminodeoxychorismate synthase component I [Solirubrobacterales bacterium]
MKTLLIDNYDSFTYNLFQLLSEANGEEPIVVRNDEMGWEELAASRDFDNIVISPGPGNPDREDDFGVCADAIRGAEVPLLGVCLGHQGLCSAYGAKVVHAPEAMHGRISAVTHEDSGLFAGLPREFQVVRYHSLCVEQPLPEELEGVAWTSDGILMAVAHKKRPQWGLQFHPESISTEHGRALLARFRDLTVEHTGRRGNGGFSFDNGLPKVPSPGGSGLELRVKRLDSAHDTERAFSHLYGASSHAFWLDSSLLDGRARFSFMGDASGPLGQTITYDVDSGQLRVEGGGESRVLEESIFAYLSREMRRLRYLSDDLPFDFNCGFAGYFGYELKADVEGSDAHSSTMPDAFFVFADRMIAFDHLEGATYVLGVCERGESEETDRWIAETSLRLASLPPISEPEWSEVATEGEPVRFNLARSHQQYLDDIAECHRQLIDGESYEICLTNKITAEISPDPLALYRTLRRVNPAPFSAYLRIGEAAVASSSPERFLSIGRDRWVEAKPIKGTVRRGKEPAEDVRLAEEMRLDEKTRAENLMICDLLRNDMGIVCEIGTVHVPNLMHVESYETVHQLVSTVRGLLREELEPPDCIRACFPGGSMTGAPKKRTMEIIDGLEGEARGVYSGAIGYLGLSGGCDLNIVIRTVVMDGEETTIRVGGAIVMQSDAEDEYEEILLKARAPMQAIDPRVDPTTVFESAPRTSD